MEERHHTPHADKTGYVLEFLGTFSTGFGQHRAMIRVDEGIDRQGVICVSIRCLEEIP